MILRPHAICQAAALREGTLRITLAPSKAGYLKFLFRLSP